MVVNNQENTVIQKNHNSEQIRITVGSLRWQEINSYWIWKSSVLENLFTSSDSLNLKYSNTKVWLQYC